EISFSACDVLLPQTSLFCGRKGLVETPQCVAINAGRLKPAFAANVAIPLVGARLNSHPRKAKYISGARTLRYPILQLNKKLTNRKKQVHCSASQRNKPRKLRLLSLH